MTHTLDQNKKRMHALIFNVNIRCFKVHKAYLSSDDELWYDGKWLETK